MLLKAYLQHFFFFLHSISCPAIKTVTRHIKRQKAQFEGTEQASARRGRDVAVIQQGI